MLNDETASKYVSGTAVHWYFDDDYPATRLTKVHDSFTDKFILYTEASYSKYWPYSQHFNSLL
jgi:O-glycosyl hydrolase